MELIPVEEFFNKDLNHADVVQFLTFERENARLQSLEAFSHCGVIPRRPPPRRNPEPNFIYGDAPDCPNCQGVPLSCVLERGRNLGWRYKCNQCLNKIDPKGNTLLQDVRLGLNPVAHNCIGPEKVFRAAYEWLLAGTHGQAQHEAGGLATDTIAAWFKFYRNVAFCIAWHDVGQIGGPTDVVEIDETHLATRKNNAGRLAANEGPGQVWVLGGISKVTSKVFATFIENKSAAVMIPIISHRVHPMSYVCTDGHLTYRACGNHFPNFGWVNHSTNFVDPPVGEDPMWLPEGRLEEVCLDSNFIGPAPAGPNGVTMRPFRVNTQTIENAWKSLKKVVKSYHDPDLAEKYCGEWMYRRNILRGLNLGAQMKRLLTDCARVHPGIGKVGMAAQFINQGQIENCPCHECTPN